MNDEIKLYIKIVGFEYDINYINKILDMKPTKSWNKGEKRHPSATILHKQNGWMLRSNLPSNSTINDQAHDLIESIRPKKKQLIDLSKKAEITIYCSVYTSLGRPEIYFGKDIIKFLSEINAAIDVDSYILE